jgi:hypothetical protein
MNTAVNPYAPPRAHVADIDSASTDAERIRKEHIKREASIRSVGVLYYIGGGFMVLAGIGLLVSFNLMPEAPERSFLIIMAPIYLGLGALSIAVGRGLRTLQPWARTVCLILSFLGLLGFPVGTLVNAYILYLLISAQGKRVFEDDYRGIVAATPHIKYRTSIVAWVILGVLLLAIVAFIVLATTR